MSQFTELLSQIMHENSWNKATIAKKMGVSKSYVTQLLQGKKNISLRSLARLFFRLDKRLNIELGELDNVFDHLRLQK